MSYYVTNENSFLDINNAHLRVTGNVHATAMKIGAIEVVPGSNVDNLEIRNADKITFVGTSNTVVDTTTGRLGIGTDTPEDTLHVNGGIRFAGHILPTQNATFDIGSATNKVRDLFLHNNSLWIGDQSKIAFSGGKLKFKRRKLNKVPKMIKDLAIAHGRTNEVDVGDHAVAFAHAIDSTITEVADLKLEHWRDYTQTFDSTKSISDIFVDNDEDYEAVTASDAFMEVGSNIFTYHSLSIGSSADPQSNLHVTGDAIITGNLTVLGTSTTIDTERLRISDPIIEIGKDNSTSAIVDLGLVMTRPSGSSNVAIIYDESASKLEIGYTQGNASQSSIAMETGNPLHVNVNGSISGDGSGLTTLNASNISSGTVAAARVAILNQNTTGSAATLTTARNINGVAFNGSADINIVTTSTIGVSATTGVNAGVTATNKSNGLGVDIAFTLPQGQQGIQGITGAVGARGIQGIQGIQGGTGGTGATGARGIQGIQGGTGGTGATGARGATGATGANGYTAGHNLTRTSFSNGYMIGYQNGPSGASDAKTNPIYTIGTSHLPNDTSLVNMYGIGYSHGNFNGILTGGWGMYVAADGDARIGLNATHGHIKCTGHIYGGNTVYVGGSTTRGLRSVSGNYGTVQTTGEGVGNHEGYSIDGRYVFMSGDSNSCGIYNDVDNEWMIYCYRNSYTKLYYNGAEKLETRNADVHVNGLYSNGTSRLGAGGQMIYMGGNRSNYFMRFNDDLGLWDPQNGELQLTNGAGNRYGTLRGILHNQSSREYKKDITRLSDTDINTMYNDTLTTDLFSFYFKGDTPGNDKRRMGIILEESPEYLSPTIDGKGLDSTHWLTMLHGAVKVIDKNVKTVMHDMQNHLNFTGQHRTLIAGIPLTDYELYEGLIVSSNTDLYYNDSIEINEALPIVSISKKMKDKACFGVISLKEDPNNYEHTAYIEREDGDVRVRVNAIGEGAIWVSNVNGNLEAGDYITTSTLPGYGQKQDSEFLANYTVAKITMNCDFAESSTVRKRIKREMKDVTYYIQDIENVAEKDLYDRWDPTRRLVKERECYAKTFVTTSGTPLEGGWIEYSNDAEATSIKKEEYDQLEESKKAEYEEVYKKTITRTITPHAWSMGNTKYQQEYTKTTSQFLVIVTHKETKQEPPEGYNYTTETRQEMVNVLDEHGQLQWEYDPSGETEKAYKIRYLDANGDITDEANAVHIAAFVGCTYHCG